MAKLADAPDLGSGGAILRGSSPLLGTQMTLRIRCILKSIAFYAGCVILIRCQQGATKTRTLAWRFIHTAMSEKAQPTPQQLTEILVPVRYLPGKSQRFCDDFFEVAFGPIVPATPLKFGTLLEPAKHCLLVCCTRADSMSQGPADSGNIVLPYEIARFSALR